MKLELLLCVLVVAATANWVPKNYPTLNEQNEIVQKFGIQLKQLNLEKLHKISLAVEDPKNKEFGKFLTIEQVRNIVGQPDQILDKISQWFSSKCENTCELNVKIGAHGDYISVETCLARIQCIFNLKLQRYENENGNIVFRSDNLQESTIDVLPEETKSYVEDVIHIWDFPDFVKPLDIELWYTAGVEITPVVVRQHYGLESYDGLNASASQQSSQAFAIMNGGGGWLSTDLASFQQNYSVPLNNVAETVEDPQVPTRRAGKESTMDSQYLTSVTDTTTWAIEATGFHDYLQTLACTGGVPLVHSMSYGLGEMQYDSITGPSNTRSIRQMRRINTEFEKLTTCGFTFIISSGDNGPYNRAEKHGCPKFDAAFPATSPFVTAVGATYLESENGSQCLFNYSGAGFSNIFQRPQWQEDAYNAYLSTGVKMPNSELYNATGRIIPDVSAYGTNISILKNGKWRKGAGTSASAPIFASMIGYANTLRQQSGKGPLGNINPRLYASGGIGTDITCGKTVAMYSNLCQDVGFEATRGWDIGTGWGTPVADKLFEVLMQ